MIRILATLSVAAFIGAAFPGDRASASEFVLTDAAPYQIDASALDIRIESRPGTDYPNVGHRAATPYDQAIKLWAEKRFVLTGNSVNGLRVSLIDGQITEAVLPITKGIKGWFKKEPATEFRAALAVSVAIVSPDGRVLATTDGKAWQTTSFVEGTVPREKDDALVKMVSETFAMLDRELGPRFLQHLGPYLGPSVTTAR
jgi:hypothetical protein